MANYSLLHIAECNIIQLDIGSSVLSTEVAHWTNNYAKSVEGERNRVKEKRIAIVPSDLLECIA